MMDTELAAKMISRADADDLPEDHDMRVLAANFDDAAKGFYGDEETKTDNIEKFMSAWANARIFWCEYSGEEFI